VLRYGSVNVPITAAGVIVYGIILLTSPATSFTSPAFQQGPFLLLDQKWWALGFIVAGLLALAVPHPVAVFPLILTVCGWAISMVLAAVTVDGVTPTAGLSWAIIATCLLVSIGVRGIHPHRGTKVPS
jgi:hypothetical protein